MIRFMIPYQMKLLILFLGLSGVRPAGTGDVPITSPAAMQVFFEKLKNYH